ncbi:MAG: Acyl-CoA synthetase member 3, mitochondrial [Vezdaea aestivalis]|nr:MAG: Acyl-CoA synthetase member 3, mitochondrial [Vezdaea aestivalis]
MPDPLSRLSKLAAHLSPWAEAIYHVTLNNKILRQSYQATADRALGLAYFLKEHGLKRVGILCPNSPAFLESIFGIGAAGGVNVAINYRLKPVDLAYIFDHAEVEAIIVDSELAPLLQGFCESHPHVRLIIDTDTDVKSGEAGGAYNQAIAEGLKYNKERGDAGWSDLETQASDENDLIALAYTSGTTAKPKGVEYTHRGAYLAALSSVVESSLNSDDDRCRYLWTLPMFHAMGWTYPWAVTAVRGTHYCLRKVDYPEIWRLLHEEQISHYNAAPTVNTILCNAKEAKKLPKPVRVTVAASPPSPQLFREMIDLNLLPIHVYGMTETYGPITKGYILPAWDLLSPDEKFAKMARQGHGAILSLPIRVIKTEVPTGTIIDVAKDGKDIGEIVFTGNICCRGYYRNPEATAELFAGGVLHSGDLAVWHHDRSIQILDRAKDIIISGGENISSVALEAMLMTHPDVFEAGVVAVADERWGERPKAFITIKVGAEVSAAAITEWAKHKSDISRFMIPEIEVVAELPKTSTGKIKKNVLRAWTKGESRGLDG